MEFLAQLFVNIFEWRLTCDDSFYRTGSGNKGVVNGLNEKEQVLAGVLSCFTGWRCPNSACSECRDGMGETQAGPSPPSWEVLTWLRPRDPKDKVFLPHLYWFSPSAPASPAAKSIHPVQGWARIWSPGSRKLELKKYRNMFLLKNYVPAHNFKIDLHWHYILFCIYT